MTARPIPVPSVLSQVRPWACLSFRCWGRRRAASCTASSYRCCPACTARYARCPTRTSGCRGMTALPSSSSRCSAWPPVSSPSVGCRQRLKPPMHPPSCLSGKPRLAQRLARGPVVFTPFGLLGGGEVNRSDYRCSPSRMLLKKCTQNDFYPSSLALQYLGTSFVQRLAATNCTTGQPICRSS